MGCVFWRHHSALEHRIYVGSSVNSKGLHVRVDQHKHAAQRCPPGHQSVHWDHISNPEVRAHFTIGAVVDRVALSYTNEQTIRQALPQLIEGTLVIYMNLLHREWIGHALNYTTKDAIKFIATIRSTAPSPMPSLTSTSLNVAFPLLQSIRLQEPATPDTINDAWEKEHVLRC